MSSRSAGRGRGARGVRPVGHRSVIGLRGIECRRRSDKEGRRYGLKQGLEGGRGSVNRLERGTRRGGRGPKAGGGRI